MPSMNGVSHESTASPNPSVASTPTVVDPNLTRELLRSTVEATQKSLRASGELYKKSEVRLSQHVAATQDLFNSMEARMKALEDLVVNLQSEVYQLKKEKAHAVKSTEQAANTLVGSGSSSSSTNHTSIHAKLELASPAAKVPVETSNAIHSVPPAPSQSAVAPSAPQPEPEKLIDVGGHERTAGRPAVTTNGASSSEHSRALGLNVDGASSARILYTDETLRNREREVQKRLGQIEEMEALLKDEEKRLQEWKVELEEQARKQKDRQAILDDHEQEVEQRLKLVQQREADQYFKEGMLAMLARGKTHQEQVATNFRREQDTKALKKELKERLEMLNKAEQKWCEKTGSHYVPLVL